MKIGMVITGYIIGAINAQIQALHEHWVAAYRCVGVIQ